jgi:hypothetical protein
VVLALVGLGEYVGFRAWALSFTHDESVSYLAYVRGPLWPAVLSHGTDANNHPLNTVAMKLGDDLFGPSEIALRWSSLVAFVVYVAALAVILRRVERRSLRVLGLALGVVNPYVLDFFSLARGYGLALALVAVSTLFALDFVEQPGSLRALGATGSAAFAVLANFATLTYFLAVLVVIGLGLVVPSRPRAGGATLAGIGASVLVPTVGVALLAGVPLARLRSEGELYFGGASGFWRDTVYGLVSSTLYHRGWDALAVGVVVLVAASVAVGAAATALSIRRRALTPHAIAFVLLSVPAVVSVAQHHVLGTPFLIERTALFFVPLFAVWGALAADAVARRPSYGTAIGVWALVVVAAACVNVLSAANLSYVLDWRYDAMTKRLVGDLAGSSSDPRPVALGVSYLFAPTTGFYRETRFRWLPECPPDCLARRSDYYYVIGPDVELVRGRGARLLRDYAPSGGVLARGSP